MEIAFFFTLVSHHIGGYRTWRYRRFVGTRNGLAATAAVARNITEELTTSAARRY